MSRKERPPVICIECGATAELVKGDVVYPHRTDLHAKWFWRCQCGAYTGCHGDSKSPKGKPAGPETREARIKAHAMFDPMWKAVARRDRCGYDRARGRAYVWLQGQMGMTPEECHIGMMTLAQAQRVQELCEPYQRRRN